MIFGEDFIVRKSINELKIDGKQVGDEEDNKDEFAVDTNDNDSEENQNNEEEQNTENDNNDDEDEFKIQSDEENQNNEEEQDTENDNNDDENKEQDQDDNDKNTNDNENEEQDQGDEDEFKIDSDENTEDDNSDENADNANSDEGNVETDDTEGEDNDNTSKAEELEKDIFSSLTPEQQKVMNKELKNNFFKLFIQVSETYEKINELDTPTEEITDTVSRLMNTLNSMKEYIQDYLSNIYNNKTYNENMICFQKYLTIYKAIGQVLKELQCNLKNKLEYNEE